MRQSILVCIIIVSCLPAFSQQNRNLAVYSSFFNTGDLVEGLGVNKTMGGWKTVSGKNVFMLGAEYRKPLTKHLSLAAGMEYADHEIITVERLNTPPFTIFDPVKSHIQFLSIPVYLRYDLLKYFFFSFGTVIDFQLKNDATNNQSGMAITGGTGVKYDFRNGMTVFMHPFYQYHGVVFFNRAGNYPEHLINAGIRTGVSFRF